MPRGNDSALTVSTHAAVATVLIDHAPINLMTVPVYLELADRTPLDQRSVLR